MILDRVPIRKCIACSEHKPKKEFLMVVRPAKSDIVSKLYVMDGEDKKSGRGYYICKDLKCIQKAKKAHRFERLFSKKYDFDPERLYVALEEAVQSGE